MAKLSFKIAHPIIIAGFFVMVSLIAINYNNLNAGFYFIFSCLALYLFFFGFATGQNFSIPIKKLLQEVNDLVKGNLKSRFSLERKDEIGQLSDAFNKMADKFEEMNFENEKTKRSISIKVDTETQSLREIIDALEQKVRNRTLQMQTAVEEMEKFKARSLTKEAELAELKNQVIILKEQLEKNEIEKVKPKVRVKKEKNKVL